MLLRGTLKPEAFLSCLFRTIDGSSHCRKDAADCTREAAEERGRMFYLAGGYWRAIPTWDEQDELVGVSLVNPDCTPEQCRDVEKGLAVLCHVDYVART